MTNKRKEMDTNNTTKQTLNVMLIEDRKITWLVPKQKKKEKTGAFCNAYQLNSLYLDLTNINWRIQMCVFFKKNMLF